MGRNSMHFLAILVEPSNYFPVSKQNLLRKTL